ncbi:hypothetical protein ACRU3B_10645 [Mycobacterium colombiense]
MSTVVYSRVLDSIGLRPRRAVLDDGLKCQPPTLEFSAMRWIAERAKRLRGAWRADGLWVLNAFALATAFLLALAIVQAIELRRVQPVIVWGSVSDAFAACGTILAVVVALRQASAARKQAAKDAKDAAERLERELSAAEQRHQDQMREQREVAALEVENQVQMARVQRLHIREQDFKNALIRITRAAGAYTHELATLVETGRRAVKEPPNQRSGALHDVSRQLGRYVQDFSIELAGAHMLTQNDDIHEALNRVNAAMMGGPYAEIGFRDVVMRAASTDRDVTAAARQIFSAIEELQTRLGEARQLAGDILNTGWD